MSDESATKSSTNEINPSTRAILNFPDAEYRVSLSKYIGYPWPKLWKTSLHSVTIEKIMETLYSSSTVSREVLAEKNDCTSDIDSELLSNKLSTIHSVATPDTLDLQRLCDYDINYVSPNNEKATFKTGNDTSIDSSDYNLCKKGFQSSFSDLNEMKKEMDIIMSEKLSTASKPMNRIIEKCECTLQEMLSAAQECNQLHNQVGGKYFKAAACNVGFMSHDTNMNHDIFILLKRISSIVESEVTIQALVIANQIPRAVDIYCYALSTFKLLHSDLLCLNFLRNQLLRSRLSLIESLADHLARENLSCTYMSLSSKIDEGNVSRRNESKSKTNLRVILQSLARISGLEDAILNLRFRFLELSVQKTEQLFRPDELTAVDEKSPSAHSIDDSIRSELIYMQASMNTNILGFLETVEQTTNTIRKVMEHIVFDDAESNFDCTKRILNDISPAITRLQEGRIRSVWATNKNKIIELRWSDFQTFISTATHLVESLKALKSDSGYPAYELI